MKRREFLGRSLETASALIAGWTLLTPALARAAESQGLPVTELRKSLSSNQALILLPEDSEYARYLASYNLRTHQAPQLRVLPRNAEGVQAVIVWARKNQIPFAVRCGGHSYEGLSQSRSVVIDVRLLKSINLSGDKKSVDVGSGCALGDVYQALGVHELAIPAGSCPSVGVSGHTLGGGYGLLARPFGLACDSLIEIELVDADGKILIASENRNADLFWACRGGGAGSFGVVTRLKFKTHSVKRLEVFGLGWSLSPDEAASVFGTCGNRGRQRLRRTSHRFLKSKARKTGRFNSDAWGNRLDLNLNCGRN
jgi:FAD/FMN-containing dehydrogenase